MSERAAQSVSRRRFMASGVAGGLAAAAVLSLPTRSLGERRARGAERFFEWEEAAPGVWVAYAPGGGPTLGGNSSLVLGKGAGALVDTKYPAIAAAVRREAESFGVPLRMVANTHHHADHTGGNLVFTPDLPVLAHANAAPRIPAQLRRYTDGIAGMAASLAKMEGEAAKEVAAEAQGLVERAAELTAAEFTPTKAIEIDVAMEPAGAMALHAGPAHTDNDIALWLPESNALVTGDLVFAGLHPFLDRSSGGTSQGWIKVLGVLLARCDDKTVVIPGHGRHGGRELLTRQSEYLAALWDLMTKAVGQGVPRDEALKAKVPEAFADYGFQQMFPTTLAAVYEEAREAAAAPR